MSTDKNNLVYQEQLDDNVIEMLSEDIGSNYSLRTENTRAVVGALNEIKGKDIISNAVGSPLVFDDTFEVMGEKIKGLTNDFKTKLLNLGISVSNIDKFEALIEKLDEINIDTDVEELLGPFIESLSGILEDEGVELSGNETLGELIIKVDEEFDRQVVPAGDASVNDVIAGKTFMNSSGELLTGLFKLGDDVYASDEELLVLLNGTISISSKSTIVISSAILPFTGTIRMHAEVSVDSDSISTLYNYNASVVFNLYRDDVVIDTYSYQPNSTSYTDMTYDFNVQFGDIIKIETTSSTSVLFSYKMGVQNMIIKGTIGIKPPEEDGGDSGEVEDDETITNPIVAGKSKELFEKWVYTDEPGESDNYTYTVDTIDGYTEGEVYFDICPDPEYSSNVDEIKVTGYMYLNDELKCSKSLVSEGTWYADHFYYGPFSIKQGDKIKCVAEETSSDGESYNSCVIFGVCYDNLNEMQ